MSTDQHNSVIKYDLFEPDSVHLRVFFLVYKNIFFLQQRQKIRLGSLPLIFLIFIHSFMHLPSKLLLLLNVNDVANICEQNYLIVKV